MVDELILSEYKVQCYEIEASLGDNGDLIHSYHFQMETKKNGKNGEKSIDPQIASESKVIYLSLESPYPLAFEVGGLYQLKLNALMVKEKI